MILLKRSKKKHRSPVMWWPSLWIWLRFRIKAFNVCFCLDFSRISLPIIAIEFHKCFHMIQLSFNDAMWSKKKKPANDWLWLFSTVLFEDKSFTLKQMLIQSNNEIWWSKETTNFHIITLNFSNISCVVTLSKTPSNKQHRPQHVTIG